MIMKGQKINDRYQIIKSIGEGGMANVYMAYDTILDRNVAIKVLRGDLAADDKFVRRFQREALSASSLAHPNIVEVYDVGEDNGQYYIVMEHVEGKHLKELVKKRGTLTVSEVIDIMLQITEGMAAAHDSYIIHRDIKPQNILILENGLVKITDFGIAMAINSTQLTQTNSVMGSVHYLPPEQASGKGASLKSDIYSMGILMYELLTGNLPFKGDNAVEIALKHLKEDLPDIKELLPNIPQSVENVILKATSKNPKNRYNDAREMNEDLKTVLAEERLKEPKFVPQYPEIEFDDTKIIKNVENNMIDEIKSEVTPIAKQITENDLKKQNKLLLILGAIFAGLVIIITTIVVLLPYLAGGKEIKVPDVRGKTVSEAIKILQDAGFEVSDEEIEIPDAEIKSGNIIKTNPAANKKRNQGTTITLYVSTGDNAIILEDYTGKNFTEIETILKAAGIIIIPKPTPPEKDSTFKEPDIFKQSPEAGTRVTAGDTVTLYYVSKINKYPDFKDGTWKLEDIEEFCEEYGITLLIEYAESTEPKGTILYQSRPPEYTISVGAELKIRVATPIEDFDCIGEGLC